MKFNLNLGGRELVVKVENLAEQANGNILVCYGETMVLATVVMSDFEKTGIDFFPLTVD